LVPPQPYPEYRRSGLYPSLCAHNTNAIYASLLHSNSFSQNRCKFLHSSNDNNVLSLSLSLYKLTIELFFLDIADWSCYVPLCFVLLFLNHLHMWICRYHVGQQIEESFRWMVPTSRKMRYISFNNQSKYHTRLVEHYSIKNIPFCRFLQITHLAETQ
jgi:hypothetical protein